MKIQLDKKYSTSIKVIHLHNKSIKSNPPQLKVIDLDVKIIVVDVIVSCQIVFRTRSYFIMVGCPETKIDPNYWTSKDCPATENARTGPRSDFSSREKLFICLLRLRRGFTLKTLAALLSTPERKIDPS